MAKRVRLNNFSEIEVGMICKSINHGDFEILRILEPKGKVEIKFLNTNNVCIKNYYDIKYGEVCDNYKEKFELVGKIITSLNDGDFKVLEFGGTDKIGNLIYSIQFLNTGNVYHNIIKGNIKKRSVADTLIHEYKIGDIIKTNQGDIVKIIDGPFKIEKSGKIRQIYKIQSVKYPQFISEDYSRDDLRRGTIFNPYIPNEKGGFLGIKYYKNKNNTTTKSYSIWSGILDRKDNDRRNNRKNYQDIKISEEWYDFENFDNFFQQEISLYKKYNEDDIECDKDFLFLINKAEKRIYSKETCLLLPSRLNRFLISFYKPTTLKSNSTYKFKVDHNRGNWGYYRYYNDEKLAYEDYFKEKEKTFSRLLLEYKDIIPQKYYDILSKFNYRETYNWYHKTNY